MLFSDLEKAIDEAERFIERAGKVSEAINPCSGKLDDMCEPGANAAACRRASLDLTKALAKLRRREWGSI